jgi:hypothetical protein
VCHGAHNQTLYPDNDSLVFYTHPAEAEPNNTFAAADTLTRFCDGILATTEDTDIYVLADRPGKLVLTCLDSRAALQIVDSAGTLFSPVQTSDAGASLDTFALPDTLRPPLYCMVYSQYHVALCRYVLGTLGP